MFSVVGTKNLLAELDYLEQRTHVVMRKWVYTLNRFVLVSERRTFRNKNIQTRLSPFLPLLEVDK